MRRDRSDPALCRMGRASVTGDRKVREGEALLFALNSAAGFRRASERKLKEYMRDAIDQGVTMEEIAEATKMDVNTLNEIIEREYEDE